MRPTRQVAAAVLLCVAAAGARAQAAPEDPTAGAIKLDLAKAEAWHGGRLVLMEGQTVAGRPTRFSLEGLFVMQPVVATLQARGAQPAIELAAVKPLSKAPARRADADAQGRATLSFRAQGDALLQVSAPAAVPYQLAVWVGPEMNPPLPSPFKATPAATLRPGAKP